MNRLWALTQVKNWRRRLSLLLVGLGFALLVFSSWAQDESRRSGSVMNLVREGGGNHGGLRVRIERGIERAVGPDRAVVKELPAQEILD